MEFMPRLTAWPRVYKWLNVVKMKNSKQRKERKWTSHRHLLSANNGLLPFVLRGLMLPVSMFFAGSHDRNTHISDKIKIQNPNHSLIFAHTLSFPVGTSTFLFQCWVWLTNLQQLPHLHLTSSQTAFKGRSTAQKAEAKDNCQAPSGSRGLGRKTLMVKVKPKKSHA